VAGLLAGLALGALVLGPVGCDRLPDPLVVSADLLNASAGVLSARVRAHNAHTEQLVAEARARCATPGSEERLACESAAARRILDDTATERAQLDQLDLLHATARDALTLADRCRRDQATCEASATSQAVEALERLRSALARVP
jgi:hypothetical protein